MTKCAVSAFAALVSGVLCVAGGVGAAESPKGGDGRPGTGNVPPPVPGLGSVPGGTSNIQTGALTSEPIEGGPKRTAPPSPPMPAVAAGQAAPGGASGFR